MKLNQAIAIEQGIKVKAGKTANTVYHEAQKPALFDGLVRIYNPLDETGEKFPTEIKLLQFRVKDLVKKLQVDIVDWFNITCVKDTGNCTAKADIVVDGTTIASNVPVTTLLFLEKQISIEIKNFVDELPVLDPAEEWFWDQENLQFKSRVTETTKTKKIQKPIVLMAPTKEHPGQAQLISEDVMVGKWSQTKLSGALRREEKEELQSRVEKLLKAIKLAREEANSQEVGGSTVGDAVVGFLFR